MLPWIVGTVLTVIAILRAALIPQPFVAVTLNVPFIAIASKSTVIEFVVPLMVAPVSRIIPVMIFTDGSSGTA